MNNHLIARNKVNNLTFDFGRELYSLRYKDSNFNTLTDDLYNSIQKICIKDKIEFPLVKVNGVIKVNQNTHKLYTVLLHLAKLYDIKLNHIV